MVSVLPSLDLSLIYLHDQYIYIFNTFRLNPCKTIPVFHSLARGDATAASATRCQARVRQNLSDRKLLRPKSILDRKLLRPKSILDRKLLITNTVDLLSQATILEVFVSSTGGQKVSPLFVYSEKLVRICKNVNFWQLTLD